MCSTPAFRIPYFRLRNFSFLPSNDQNFGERFQRFVGKIRFLAILEVSVIYSRSQFHSILQQPYELIDFINKGLAFGLGALFFFLELRLHHTRALLYRAAIFLGGRSCRGCRIIWNLHAWNSQFRTAITTA